jgi:hypothetical protein
MKGKIGLAIFSFLAFYGQGLEEKEVQKCEKEYQLDGDTNFTII